MKRIFILPFFILYSTIMCALSPGDNFIADINVRKYDNSADSTIVSCNFQVISENSKTCRVYTPKSGIYNNQAVPKETTGWIVIPSTINGYTVKQIGSPEAVSAYTGGAFGLTHISGITLPESLERIYASVFYGCSSLSHIMIPESVSLIGDDAFRESGITSIFVPENVTFFGKGVFVSCSNLTTVTFNANITNLPDNTFSYSALKAITLSNSINSLGNSAFDNCGNLESITLPNALESIGECTFYNCGKLRSINLPKTLTRIEKKAFYRCSSLSLLIIPNSVTSIGDYAFLNCNMTSINVPVIDFSAFCNNKVVGLISSKIRKPVRLIDKEGNEINEYVIPNDVESIGDMAFSNCINLNSITFSKSITNVSSSAFQDCKGLVSVVFHCKEIGSWVSGLTSIKDVVIGEEVIGIGENAFKGCRGLTSVNIPDNVTKVGIGAFYQCSSLWSVIVGKGVTELPNYVFGTGFHIYSLTICSTALSISSNAFKQSSTSFSSQPIKTIWLTNTPPTGYANAEGWINYVANDLYTKFSNKKVYPFLSSMFEVDGIKYVPVSPSERTCDAIDCAYNESAENINVGKSVLYKGIHMTVKNINQYVGFNNNFITNVNISLEGDIGNLAFSDCYGITKVIVTNVGNIGISAFSGCNKIIEAVISNVGDIGDKAFYGCTKLETANVQNSGTIGAYAFYNCSSLQKDSNT